MKFLARLSQCTYRCVALPDLPTSPSPPLAACLNAHTGAWCSLTHDLGGGRRPRYHVSMHLQVRGAP